jgi:hypothetical protein
MAQLAQRFGSIWRMRSRVTAKDWPPTLCEGVLGAVFQAKAHLDDFLSLGVSVRGASNQC